MNDRGRPLSTGERKFLETFFQRLEQARIPAILLRNYEKFPEHIGHDLDVYFHRRDLRAAIDVFKQLLRESGGELMHVHERDYVLAVWFRTGPQEPLEIHFDFYHGAFTWRGLPYLSPDEVIGSCRRFREYTILRPAHEALTLFLISPLWGGFFKERYRERIRTLLQDPAEAAVFQQVLRREFGAAGPPPFDLNAEAAPPVASMRSYARRLRQALIRRSLLRRPIASLFRCGRFWLGELGTLLRPPGIAIAVLGPDGSGKSTTLAGVKERLEHSFGERVEHHWRPALLPDIGILLGKRSRRTGPVSDPHDAPPHSPVASAIRLLYYWLDYWLGNPVKVRTPKAKNYLVLFDRYAQDMWCDPRRYRLKLPLALTRALCRLVPQPDLVFVLLADAETIRQRKNEVPLESLRELLSRYREASQGRRTRALDCSRPAAEVAADIEQAVRAVLKQRAQRHRRFS